MMDLEFQIVVQFPVPASIKHAEDVLSIEDHLSDAVGSAAEVDGHDVSPTKVNVFVLTGDPDSTFAALRARMSAAFPHLSYEAAWRKCCDNDDWTVLWPVDQRAFSLD